MEAQITDDIYEILRTTYPGKTILVDGDNEERLTVIDAESFGPLVSTDINSELAKISEKHSLEDGQIVFRWQGKNLIVEFSSKAKG